MTSGDFSREFPPTALPTQKLKRWFWNRKLQSSYPISVSFWIIFKADFTQTLRIKVENLEIPGIQPGYQLKTEVIPSGGGSMT